jgi:PiT family inorganic phosphate transporter
MWKILGGLFMGWSLGANDAANVFGPGVSARVLKYRTAVLLTAFFVILGASLEGPKCMQIIKDVGKLTPWTAFIATMAAGFTITLMTFLAIPSSTSQAIMGAILGVCLVAGQPNWWVLGKAATCWVFTPIGAALVAFVLMKILIPLSRVFLKTAKAMNRFALLGILVAGCYGAYSLGTNNVANVTGAYVSAGMLESRLAALIGGVAIAFGALTFSWRVMHSVGHDITMIGPIGALVALLAEAITVHFYTQVGVPVSTSQAVVGAVIGIGLVRGIKAVSRRKVIQIFVGWMFTPITAAVITYAVVRWILPYVS